MTGYFKKDADGDNDNVIEPKVFEEVKKEIAAFGENTKKNYDELRGEYEELKKTVDAQASNSDTLIEEKYNKLAEAITTRQEDIDKKATGAAKELEDNKIEIHKRMDDIEVAMKRVPKEGDVSSDDLKKLEKEARDFQIQTMVARDVEDKGVKHSYLNNLDPDVEAYKAYKPAFERFLRTDDRKGGLSPEDWKSLSVAVDPDGGYTVTPVMLDRITKRIYESDPIRQLASVQSITTGALEFIADYDEASSGWEDERTAGGETDTPTLNKKRITTHVLYAKPRATQVLLEDSGINIENWLADKVAKRFLRVEGAAFGNGDGIGKPRGFLTYPDYTTAGTDAWGQIEQIAMGAAATLTADGFVDVKYSLIEDYLNRGTWLMNRTTVAAAMKLKTGTGEYIWSPGLAEDKTSMILSLPVRMSTTMPVVAANALSVAIADWSETYMVVDRLGVTVQRDPYTVKPLVEFYTRKRVGGDVINYQSIKLGVIST